MGRSLVSDSIARYAATWAGETPVQVRLRAETARLPKAVMQIGPDQARFLSFLVRFSGAKRALEIGTFTGYSGLTIASALPPDGKLVTCDISEEWTAIARRYWQEAGVAPRIDLRLAPALETLAALERDKHEFDFAFIDAHKPEYDAYYEACLRLVPPGGLIVIDNTIWGGDVADPAVNDDSTAAIRTLNDKVRNDPRVDASLLTVGDGVIVARRLPP